MTDHFSRSVLSYVLVIEGVVVVVPQENSSVEDYVDVLLVAENNIISLMLHHFQVGKHFQKLKTVHAISRKSPKKGLLLQKTNALV